MLKAFDTPKTPPLKTHASVATKLSLQSGPSEGKGGKMRAQSKTQPLQRQLRNLGSPAPCVPGASVTAPAPSEQSKTSLISASSGHETSRCGEQPKSISTLEPTGTVQFRLFGPHANVFR